MPLLSSPVPNLVNGVSQQAPTLRLASQLEAQENAYSSVVEGLGKRPPTKHVSVLDSGDGSNAAYHLINRDSGERYIVQIDESGIRVFDLTGDEKTVTVEGAALDYLACDAAAKSSLRALTVEDYTFILNTETTVDMSELLSPNPGQQGLVFVKQGQYSTDYNVFINSFPVATKTTSASDPDDIKTDAIAADLVTTLTTNLDTIGVSAATWTEGGIAAESTLTINGWTGTSPMRFKRLTGTQEYQVGDSIGFSSVGGSSGSSINGNSYVITNAQLSFSGTYPHLTPFWVYTMDHSVTGSLSGGSVHRTARQGETRAGTLTESGAFTGYVPAQGDLIYLQTGTGITEGTYQIAAESRWDSGCHGNDFIQLLASPSTANVSLMTGDIASYNNWLITRNGSTILIKRGDGAPFTLRTSDSYGDRVLFGFKDRIQRFTDLPTICVRDYLVEITGDNAEDLDNYWVKFVPNNDAVSDFDKGVWVETGAPGISYQLDANTMPHTLVRNEDGTFTFQAATWGDRIVGDEETSPNPSFVGKTLNDIFFFRNRLGFLADENVILSVARSPFNFFSQTVTTLLDSDPVDVAATNTHVSVLRYAVPFREELLLFSDQSQYILSTGAQSLLTPSSASLNEATAFEASLLARPVVAGSNVYFGFPRGNYAGVREYFVQADSEAKDAADITKHVPRYIPGVISGMASASNEDVLICRTEADPTALYVYCYYWSNDQKLQSAWSRFSFEEDSEILAAEFIESTLHLVIQRADGIHYETMSFQPGQVDEDSTYVTLLDRRLTDEDVTIAYNVGTNTTTWTLPYEITGEMKVAVRAGDDVLSEGHSITLMTQAGTTLTALGDFTDTKVFIGQVYLMDFVPSEPVLREEAKGGGQTAVQSGRLQIRTWRFTYHKTAYFSTEVTPLGRDTFEKVFNSQALSGIANTGEVYLASGSFRFPVLAKAGEFTVHISSDSFLPCHFTGAEFEGHFTSRSQRA